MIDWIDLYIGYVLVVVLVFLLVTVKIRKIDNVYKRQDYMVINTLASYCLTLLPGGIYIWFIADPWLF
ncbi:MAG: hypothetical protein JKY33_10770 [Bacteroidia bacterium]|nr:hypothetical protein [Bacteroidia bacterium]